MKWVKPMSNRDWWLWLSENFGDRKPGKDLDVKDILNTAVGRSLTRQEWNEMLREIFNEAV